MEDKNKRRKGVDVYDVQFRGVYGKRSGNFTVC
jgi:hypothetical protein